MSENSPTRVLPVTPFRPRPDPPSKGPLVAFIVVAVLLVAASGLLLYLVFGRGGAPSVAPASTPTATGTPRAPAQAAPAPTPTEQAEPAGVFTTFAPVSPEQCQQHGHRTQTVDLQVTWGTQDATAVWLAPGTSDAAGVGEPIPLSGTQASFPYPVPLNCNAGAQTFTMTLVGDDGADVSQTWTVTIARRHG